MIIDDLKKLKDSIFGNHEAVESLDIAIEDRLISPFYGYFIISWLLVNWDFLYIGFFVDQERLYEKTKLLRSEYLLQNILPVHLSWDWFLSFIGIPFLLTFIALWVMPYITNEFYRKYLKNKINVEVIKIKETTRKRVAETEQKTELIEAEVKQAEVEKKAEEISPEILWDTEFKQFQKSSLYYRFNKIRDSIYKYNGRIIATEKSPYPSLPDKIIFEIPTDLLVFADSNNLINTHGETISLTPKGKYFMKLHSSK